MYNYWLLAFEFSCLVLQRSGLTPA